MTPDDKKRRRILKTRRRYFLLPDLLDRSLDLLMHIQRQVVAAAGVLAA